ncbi:MAG: TrkA C-terminal domain-containing protein [Sedimentisphaerales bacterium]
MTGLIGIIALLTVLVFSLIVTRVATVALTMTGLSQEAARFQARSAFTGTGFTTREAEAVVNHPVRRRIIMILMILRSAGFVTIILSLILSFLGSGDDITRIHRLGWLVAGVIVLWLLASSKRLERFMARIIEWALARWTDLDVRDYAHLLRLSGGYNVMEIEVQQGDWVAGKNLRCCYLPEEGITVLGIIRSDGTYIGGPKGDTEIYPGDILILYGRADKLRQLDKRQADVAGDQAHDAAVREQKRHIEDQDRRDQEHKRKRQAGLI